MYCKTMRSYRLCLVGPNVDGYKFILSIGRRRDCATVLATWDITSVLMWLRRTGFESCLAEPGGAQLEPVTT